MTERAASYPFETGITAYGGGGFRFADMSHRGSILCLPSGIRAWHVSRVEDLQLGDFDDVLRELQPPTIVLLGTGLTQSFVGDDIVAAFAKAGLGFEAMSTGAAARTYNIMLAEKRKIAAALIAVA